MLNYFKSASLDWPFSGVVAVHAFRMNWDDKTSFNPLVDSNGELNSTREPIEGILLNDKQVELLKGAVLGNHESGWVAACHYPHHGFIFTDVHGAIIGHIEICFMCMNRRAKPDSFGENWDFEGLKELLQSLDIEIANPEWS